MKHIVMDPVTKWTHIISDPRSQCRLLGVTGGIASGKTTVANMLGELGWPIIDFDHLARVVVEPGRPAWQDIVDFFGPDILLPDQSLDRKKIGRMVFTSPEKRTKLEGLTHPRIFEEFVTELDRLSGSRPAAIIQAVVPLLYEQRLQGLFHQVLLIYVPREVQIERLIRRESISREEATNILTSQLPIDDKLAWADYVIDNSGTVEETRQRAKALHAKLMGEA